VQELSREKKGLNQRHESLARTSRDAERKARDKLNELQEVQVRGHEDVQVQGARRRGAGRSAGGWVEGCVYVCVCSHKIYGGLPSPNHVITFHSISHSFPWCLWSVVWCVQAKAKKLTELYNRLSADLLDSPVN
jgi:hypothetical protein